MRKKPLQIEPQYADVVPCYTRAQSLYDVRICRPSARNLAGYDIWANGSFQGWAHAHEAIRILRDLLDGRRVPVTGHTRS